MEPHGTPWNQGPIWNVFRQGSIGGAQVAIAFASDGLRLAGARLKSSDAVHVPNVGSMFGKWPQHAFPKFEKLWIPRVFSKKIPKFFGKKNPDSPKCSNCFPIFQTFSRISENFQFSEHFPRLFSRIQIFQKIFSDLWEMSKNFPRPSGPRCPPAKRPTSEAGQTGDIYGDRTGVMGILIVYIYV